jgi:hypothetical protein
MFKRTKGYILLTMLVLTGLAGRIHSDTLPAKERSYLIDQLKTGKADLIKSIKSLSSKQLNFRASSKEPTLRQFICTRLSWENNLWTACHLQLNKSTSKITEGVIISNSEFEKLLAEKCGNLVVFSTQLPDLKNPSAIITEYKKIKDAELKFARTTTDNLHHYAIETNAGTLDAYQAMLLVSGYTKECIDKIEEIKLTPKFPK